MATILAYTSPARGNLYPIVALLIELQRRGHRIMLRTLAAGVPTGRALGFEASAVDRRIEDSVMTDWMAPNSRTALKVAFGVFGQRAAYEVEDVRGVIAAARPELLVVDANCWGAAAVADAGAVPWGVVLAVHTIPAIASRAAFRAGLAPPAWAVRSAARRGGSPIRDRTVRARAAWAAKSGT